MKIDFRKERGYVVKKDGRGDSQKYAQERFFSGADGGIARPGCCKNTNPIRFTGQRRQRLGMFETSFFTEYFHRAACADSLAAGFYVTHKVFIRSDAAGRLDLNFGADILFEQLNIFNNRPACAKSC